MSHASSVGSGSGSPEIFVQEHEGDEGDDAALDRVSLAQLSVPFNLNAIPPILELRYCACLVDYLPECVVELIDRICIFVAWIFSPSEASLTRTAAACRQQLDQLLTTKFEEFCPEVCSSIQHGREGGARFTAQIECKFYEEAESYKNYGIRGTIDGRGIATVIMDDTGNEHRLENSFRQLLHGDIALLQYFARADRHLQDFTLLFSIIMPLELNATAALPPSTPMVSHSFVFRFNPDGERAINELDKHRFSAGTRMNTGTLDAHQHRSYADLYHDPRLPESLKDLISEHEFEPLNS
ncbi:MAG: hypothetical protein HYX48_00145 [Chlamydiales bacterium]|nr:hypothetical protein [Chlamydiales bacterium]